MNFPTAERYLSAVKRLYIHALCYVAGSLAVLVINLLTGGPPWSIFPILGWGIGVGIHTFAVFRAPNFFPKSWEDRMLREWNCRHSAKKSKASSPSKGDSIF
ncbi:2TM domain-containing protein [Nostoc sp. NIES-2111]